jgi:hypothetical protein
MEVKIRKALRKYEFIEIKADVLDLNEAMDIYNNATQVCGFPQPIADDKPFNKFDKPKIPQPSEQPPVCEKCGTVKSWGSTKGKWYCKPCVNKWAKEQEDKKQMPLN